MSVRWAMVLVIWILSGLFGGTVAAVTGRFLMPSAPPAFPEAVGFSVMSVLGLWWTRRLRPPVAMWRLVVAVVVAVAVGFLVRLWLAW